MSGDRFQPRALLTDFDLALRNAIRVVWPSASMHWADSFHMMQACIKWLHQKGAPKDATALVIASLRRMIAADDFAAFEFEKSKFLELIRYVICIPFLSNY